MYEGETVAARGPGAAEMDGGCPEGEGGPAARRRGAHACPGPEVLPEQENRPLRRMFFLTVDLQTIKLDKDNYRAA